MVEENTKVEEGSKGWIGVYNIAIISVVALIVLGGIGIPLILGGNAGEDRKAKEETAPSVIYDIADGIDNQVIKYEIPESSKVDGFSAGIVSKGFIWVDGVTAPYTFYIHPVVTGKQYVLGSYVDVEGTVDDYTITYADENRGFTAVYNSETQKIDIVDEFQPLQEN